MIPPENRHILIKRLKDGWDIRNACKMADITRSNLYAYFKEVPEFRAEVDKTIKTFVDRKAKKEMLDKRHVLMKNKEDIKNQTNHV